MMRRIYLIFLPLLFIAISAMGKSSDVKPDIFCKLVLSKDTVYIGESFVASLVIYSTNGIEQLDNIGELKCEGFDVSELKLSNITTSYQNIEGKTYITAVLRRWILTPLKKGKQTLEISRFEATARVRKQVDYGFFSSYAYEPVTVQVPASSVSVRVQPLPGKKPAGFSGAVGLFDTDVRFSAQPLIVGQQATLKISISGVGNPGNIDLSGISMPESFILSDSSQSSEAHLTGKNIVGSKSITYQIVPNKAGRHTVVIPEFIFFDPASKKYTTLPSRYIEVSVAYGKVYEM